LVFADLELDDETHEVRRSGTPIELTVTEFRLLRYLMQNAPRVLEKAQILDHVWNYDFRGEANIVETYVSYLRKKLDADGPPLIDASGKPAGHPIQNPCYGCPTPPPPNLPATMSSSGPPGSSSLFTVGPSGGRGPDYRAIAVAAPGDTTLVVAIPMTEVSQTLGRLVWIGGAVTLA